MSEHSGRWVAYYRVSTAKQGRSGLGLEAQRQAVAQHLNGGNWKLLAEFTEAESGKDDTNRPKLQEALGLCRLRKATLIIAKLDRLSRNVAFVAKMMDSGVDFVAVDNPVATRFTLHILAAVAEHERGMISARTKAGLAVARARGKVWGGKTAPGWSSGLDEAARAKGRASKRAAALQRARDLEPDLKAIMAVTGENLTAIARELNARELTAPRGGPWTAAQVQRLLNFLRPVG